jgi:hypothetical protein
MAFNVQGLSSNLSSKFGNIGNKVVNADATLGKFFHPSVANPSAMKVLGNGSIKANSKVGLQKAGAMFNGGVYNLANKAGLKVMDAVTKPNPSFFGKLLSKVPGIGKVADGLTKLGTKGGGKIPGLGTLFAVGTAAVGLFKAGGKLLKGDFKAAGHQVLKSAGSVAGIGAGLALMATGVGFLPGLALAIGAGFAGDWAGKKAGNMIFGKMDQNGHSPSWNASHGVAQQGQTGQNLDYTVGGVAGMSNEQFDAYVTSILQGTRY